MTDLPELYVLRHGETEWNVAGRMQGSLDSRLTAKGEQQARRIGAFLAARGVRAGSHRLLASPQGRAMATARPIAEAIGAEVVPEPRLREIGMGRWTGLTRAEIDRTWPPPDPHEHVLEFYARAPDGEGFERLWQRVGALLDALAGPAVLVTHGITSRFLRARALGLPLDRLLEVPGGQGVVHHLRRGRAEVLTPGPDKEMWPPV